jgi:hypothetical protein
MGTCRKLAYVTQPDIEHTYIWRPAPRHTRSHRTCPRIASNDHVSKLMVGAHSEEKDECEAIARRAAAEAEELRRTLSEVCCGNHLKLQPRWLGSMAYNAQSRRLGMEGCMGGCWSCSTFGQYVRDGHETCPRVGHNNPHSGNRR